MYSEWFHIFWELNLSLFLFEDATAASQLQVKRRFNTWKEFHSLVEKLGEEQLVPFNTFCSVSVEHYNKKNGCNLRHDLIYQSATVACIYYGRRRENSKGIRPNQRHKILSFVLASVFVFYTLNVILMNYFNFSPLLIQDRIQGPDQS